MRKKKKKKLIPKEKGVLSANHPAPRLKQPHQLFHGSPAHWSALSSGLPASTTVWANFLNISPISCFPGEPCLIKLLKLHDKS